MSLLKPLILYFTADYPSNSTLKAFLGEIDPDVVKYVEIGIPEKNPLYDGPTIKATHSTAMGNFQRDHLGEFSDILAEKGIKTFALSYYDNIGNGGLEFIHGLKDSGFSGIIVPDLFTDHSEEAERVIPDIENIFSFIPFFNPATPDGVIESVTSMTKSWIYYGLQPSTGIDIPFDLEEVSRRIFGLIPNREINFGFGIRTIEQVREIIGLGSSGVAIGSLLVPYLKEGDARSFIDFQKSVKEVYADAQ